MPSQMHETLIELFRHRPRLAVEILTGPLGVAVPEWQQARQDKIFHALLGGLQTLDDGHADLYADFVLASLPTAVRHHLEELMSTRTDKYQSDFARRYVAEGKAEGKAEALLAFLAARGINVPEPAHERITTCGDAAQLETWIRRAATIDTIEDLFA